jgi:hypothetical protein
MGKPKDTASSRLLLHEEPLQVLPGLAVALGLNEAIILQQLHYWLRKKAHQRNGREWHYNTYEDWKKQFPFWSVSTIKRAIIHLQETGVVIAGNFNHSPIDKTKWYAIDYKKLNDFCDSATAQNEPSTDQDEPSMAQDDLSTAQNEPSTDQDEPSMAQDDPLHGSICPHQYPENNSESTDRDLTPMSLTSFETLEGTDVVPSAVDGTGETDAKPKRVRKPKQESTPLNPNRWLYKMLVPYEEQFDLAAVNDEAWWQRFAATFPDFSKDFVSGALANLAMWLQDHPREMPRSPAGWHRRFTISFNYYYTNMYLKRFSKVAPNGQRPRGRSTVREREHDMVADANDLIEEILHGRDRQPSLSPRALVNGHDV